MVVADPPPAEMSELMAAGEGSSTNGQQLYQFSTILKILLILSNKP
jgi:hypothetical protein